MFLLDPDAVTKSSRILSESDTRGSRLFYYPTSRNLHPSSLTVVGLAAIFKTINLSFADLLPTRVSYMVSSNFQEIDALTREPYNDFFGFLPT